MTTANANSLPARCLVRCRTIALMRDAARIGMDRTRVTQAIFLASQVHAGQSRSADASPYICHPLNVAQLVLHWGGEEDDVVAALLHDVAEDGDMEATESIAEIADAFGTRVARMVAAMTKNRAITDRRERMQDAQQRLLDATQHIGPGLAAVKIADRVHNTSSASHLSSERISHLQSENCNFFAPLAERLGAVAIAGYLAASPLHWQRVQADAFVPQVLAIQPAWIAQKNPG